HVVPQLLRRGHAVIAVARNEESARKLDWYDRVKFVRRDLHHSEIESLDVFDRPDAVVHLAWPGLPNYQSLFHFEENLPAAYRFLKSMVEEGVGHLLVTGTCLEYGMQSGPLAESSVTAPANPYALAKDTLHKFLRELRRHRPFTLQWARLFYMHGTVQNTNSLI